MTRKIWTTSTGAAALVACALAGATVAFGAGSTTKTTTTTTTNGTTAGKSAHTPETALTGDVLAKVKAAAIAKVGGTVDSATTENDGSNAAAAYEAHVTKADGSRVTVILDNAYNVLAVESGRAGRADHNRGRGGNGETPLTGATAAQANAAAVAKEGGTAPRAAPGDHPPPAAARGLPQRAPLSSCPTTLRSPLGRPSSAPSSSRPTPLPPPPPARRAFPPTATPPPFPSYFSPPHAPRFAGGVVRRQQRVVQDEAGDVVAERQAGDVVDPRVLAGEDPAQTGLLRGGGEAA